MKINHIKINNYGKLTNKDFSFDNHINIIYGENEAGKSTLLNFILNSFYGISKNKKGKEISDYEKYKPWHGDDFSGKISYSLNNNETYEVYRDFNKKNPKIFDARQEDISKQFNIDKNKGNEFFYEQTKIDEDLFVSTLLVPQQEVKLGKSNQNILIQKIANLVGTGDDNVSFKRALERLARKQLNEIGTQRTREKPINIIEQKIETLEKQKQDLEKYQDLKYEMDETKYNLKNEILNLEEENKLLRDLKLLQEKEKIEKEKINLKIDLKNKNDEKINKIKKEIETINSNHKNIFEKNNQIKDKKNKLNKIFFSIFSFIIFFSIVQFVLIKNIYLNYIFYLTLPIVLIFYLFFKNKINKKEKNTKIKIQNINLNINNLNSEIDLLEKNKQELEKEINYLKNNFNLKINLEKEKNIHNYKNKIEKNRINYFQNTKDINYEKENIQNLLNEKKLKLHTLEIDSKNIEPQLENLAKIQEDLVNYHEKRVALVRLDQSINLAKEILTTCYEKMKNEVTPKFTKNLSEIICEITNGKYNRLKYQDELGLILELPNGDYVTSEKLSVGTIDQLYLSLRLSMVQELSTETMPIILDEAFAFYDTPRLKNILLYISQTFQNHQILIFTCTNRESTLLKDLGIPYHEIHLKK